MNRVPKKSDTSLMAPRKISGPPGPKITPGHPPTPQQRSWAHAENQITQVHGHSQKEQPLLHPDVLASKRRRGQGIAKISPVDAGHADITSAILRTLIQHCAERGHNQPPKSSQGHWPTMTPQPLFKKKHGS